MPPFRAALSAHTTLPYPGLVDNIDDRAELAGVGTVVDEGHAPHLDVALVNLRNGGGVYQGNLGVGPTYRRIRGRSYAQVWLHGGHRRQ